MNTETLDRPRRLRLLNSGPIWTILWSAPLWAAVVPRLLRHKTPWLVDFNSVVCGGERWRAHQPIYGLDAKCPGLPISEFVYPPWIADASSYPAQWLGQRGMEIAYAILFLAALVFLFWLVFWRAIPGAERRSRATFLAFTSGNLVFVGNIAVVMQAWIIGAAVFLGAETVASTASIMLAGLIKPIYLTFLTLPAFAAAGWQRRIALVAIPAATVAALCLSHIPLVPEWRTFVLEVAVDPHPGGGLLGWLGQLGVTSHPVLTVAYLIYAALVFGAGLALAETAKLAPVQRVWLAASVGVLLLPRVMAYDLLLLGPGLVVASEAVRAISARIADRAAMLWLAACGLYLVSSLLGGVFQIGHSIALMLVAGGLVWLGAVAARAAYGSRVTASAVKVPSETLSGRRPGR